MQNWGPGVILKQDNARPYTACATTKFLAQKDVNVLLWPAVSPRPNHHITKRGRAWASGTERSPNKQCQWPETYPPSWMAEHTQRRQSPSRKFHEEDIRDNCCQQNLMHIDIKSDTQKVTKTFFFSLWLFKSNPSSLTFILKKSLPSKFGITFT
jgi:hypothetical protein